MNKKYSNIFRTKVYIKNEITLELRRKIYYIYIGNSIYIFITVFSININILMN